MIKNSTNILLLLFFLLGGTPSLAATCPRIENLNFALPPAGWSYLVVGPDTDLEKYTFHSAVHSLNAAFYYQQVICRYEACASYFCPAFTLISNSTFAEPSKATSPWTWHSAIRHTLTCRPDDHDPAHCVFN